MSETIASSSGSTIDDRKIKTDDWEGTVTWKREDSMRSGWRRNAKQGSGKSLMDMSSGRTMESSGRAMMSDCSFRLRRRESDSEDIVTRKREVMRDASIKAMPDCSFRLRRQESLGDILQGEVVKDHTRRRDSFLPDESVGTAGWDSMAALDLSIQEPNACQRVTGSSGRAQPYYQETIFSRNMDYLQSRARSVADGIGNTIFFRNIEAITSLLSSR